MKNKKLVIGIIAIVVLLIIFFVVLANSKKTVVDKQGNTVQQPGFLDSLAALFGGGSKSTSTVKAGAAVSGFYCSIFPKSKACAPKNFLKCDCKNPGYDNSGDLTPNCTEGIGSDWIKECK